MEFAPALTFYGQNLLNFTSKKLFNFSRRLERVCKRPLQPYMLILVLCWDDSSEKFRERQSNLSALTVASKVGK